MRRLEHPCIPALHRVYECEQYVFLVMEHISGASLFNLLAHKKGTTEETLWIFKELCSLCNYLESQQAVHLDLKHSSIVFSSRASKYSSAGFKVLDWSYCRFPGEEELLGALSMSKAPIEEILPCGSPGHVAPEILCQYGEPVDSRADLYSVGLIVFRL